MNKNDKIYIAGHNGMVGSAVLRRLRRDDYTRIVLRSRDMLDLTRRNEVHGFFQKERPDHVFLCAAKVGGIHANSHYPADFIRINLQIQTNVIDAACEAGVKKLLFLGSSCIYPRLAPQPMHEDSLLTGALEPTNQWYAVAKIAGIKMCQAYRRQYGFNSICAMPTNLYGPNDNFDLKSSHVLPALMRKFHEAAQKKADSVEIWGTGSPKREFLHVDDLADACLFLMRRYDGEEVVNVGTGRETSIRELAEMIAETVGFDGKPVFNPDMPDGAPRKLLDVSRLRSLGWRAGIGLREGIAMTYEWFLRNSATV